MIRSLIWKEWAEQRGRIAVASAIVMAVALLAVVGPRSEAALVWAFALGGLPMPLFLATGLFARERAGGTLEMLRVMPVGPWWVLSVKTAVGLLGCVLPFLALLLIQSVGGSFDVAPWVFLLMAFLASMTFLWTLCVSIRQPSELHAALVGVVTLCVIALVQFIDMAVRVLLHHPVGFDSATMTYDATFLIHPLSFPQLWSPNAPASALPTYFAFQTIWLATLWWWAGHRWTRAVVERRRREQPPASPHLELASRRSMFGALLWKEWREMRIAIPAGVIATTVPIACGLAAIAIQIQIHHAYAQALGAQPWNVYASMTVAIDVIAALLLPILIAVGSVSGDLRSGLKEFWCSRPFPAGRWFGAKYIMGLAVILTTLLIPLIPLCLVGWASGHLARNVGYAIASMIFVFPLVLACFSIAMLTATLIPNPGIAGILSVGVVVFLALAGVAYPAPDWLMVAKAFASLDPTQAAADNAPRGALFCKFIAAYLGLSLVFTLAAWGMWITRTGGRGSGSPGHVRPMVAGTSVS